MSGATTLGLLESCDPVCGGATKLPCLSSLATFLLREGNFLLNSFCFC